MFGSYFVTTFSRFKSEANGNECLAPPFLKVDKGG